MNQHFAEETVLGKAYDSRLIKRLIPYILAFKYYVVLAIFLLLISTLLQLAGPYLIKIGIDQYIEPKNYNGLIFIIVLFGAALVGQAIVRFFQMIVIEWIGQQIMYKLRMQIFSHLQSLPLSYFDTNPVGRLVTRVTTDVDTLNELFTGGFVAIFGDIFTLVGIVIVLFSLNWKLALLILLILPILAYVTFLIRTRLRNSFRQIRIRIAKINAFLQENITGMSIIQLFNRAEKNFLQFDELNRSHLDAYLKTIFYFSLFFPVMQLMLSVSIGLIIWQGGIQVIEKGLTFGALVAFIQYAQQFFRPLSDLAEKYNIMQAAMAASERIFKLLDEKNPIHNPANPVSLEKIAGEIEFKNVCFSYTGTTEDDRNYVLKNISFSVKPGEKIAIVGATGAGKSTIINLLARFYDVTYGEILLDGVNIKNLSLEQLRGNIGIVLQDVFIFAGTLGDNIRLGNRSISQNEIERAAKTVHIHPFIAKFSDGYEHNVTERGSTLSSGQKQLLSFARALAYDPAILVLDEATSSVDSETELLIQDALRQLMQNRTSIIIAHRLSTIQNADRIIVLHKGEIREIGPHDQLLLQSSIYKRLYELQYKNAAE
ncbi:ABC transporter ATP-binding protein [candidate division KSB1 bacterium]|nr:ABC transporter ATP-binding protein [candidate division KSB1 bacterium]